MGAPELQELYDAAVLEHGRNPRGGRRLQAADLSADGVNPFCGDEVHLQLGLDAAGVVRDAGVQCVGCSINRASGSMLAEVVLGRTLPQVDDLHAALRAALQAEAAASPSHLPGDLPALLGVRRFPVRIKCALLPWSTLDDAIQRRR